MSNRFERIYDVEVRNASDESRSFDFVASSAAVDSYDEIVEQDWDLSRYRSNPVVLWNHNISARGLMPDGESALPIGKASNVRVEGGKLLATITLASAKANPMAERVYHLLKEGILKAVSVGFVPGEVRLEKRANGDEVYVLAQNELHEISVVPVPANPEAVRRSANLEQLRARMPKTATPPVPEEERDMTELEAKLAAKAAELATAEKALADASVSVKALETQNTALVAERDAAREETKALRAQLVDLEVTSLVGTKITAVEKDTFVELALSNRELFEKFISQRSEMPLLRSAMPDAAPVRKDAVEQPVADPAAHGHNDFAELEQLVR